MNSEQKKFHSRAVRARRELEKEKLTYGAIHDGSGKRYLVGVLFLLAGDVLEANKAFDWFYAEFPDDVGEPIFFLYGALAAFRAGHLDMASTRLKETMLSNVYLLPYLIDAEIDAAGIWHSSNWAMESYLDEVGEYLDEPSEGERRWIASQLISEPFVALMREFLSCSRALATESDVSKRRAILAELKKVRVAAGLRH